MSGIDTRRRLTAAIIALSTTAISVAGLSQPASGAETVLFADGFESGTTSGWTAASGLLVQSDVASEGTYAARAAMSGGAAYAQETLSAATATATLRLKVFVESQTGTASVNFAKFRTSTSSAIAELFISPTRALGVRNDVTAVSTTSATIVSTGTWHDVTFAISVSGTTSTTSVGLDGVVIDTLTQTHNLGTNPVGRVQVGENLAGRTASLVYDAVSVSSGQPDPTTTTTTSTTTTTTSTSTATATSPPTSPTTDPTTTTPPITTTTTPPTTTTTTTAPAPAPVLAAAGDIACDPLKKNFNNLLGKAGECAMKAVSDVMLGDTSITQVAALGDVQYECGGLSAFQQSYDPTWGRFKGITRPAVGNHEYIASSTSTAATDCDPTGTAAGYYTYFGASAGDPAKGYYSYDLGTWHIVVLNTQCGSSGGCGLNSPQEKWLKADLSAHPNVCTLAYYHIPLWSSGGRANTNSKAFVTDLVAAGAEVVLAGHDHTYERFAPMNASGALDPLGVRSFVVGTGGANHTSFTTIAANSEARDATTYGYLKLTLRDGSYDWQFVPVGGTFTDSGSATCH